jgi:hypothetical protein
MNQFNLRTPKDPRSYGLYGPISTLTISRYRPEAEVVKIDSSRQCCVLRVFTLAAVSIGDPDGLASQHFGPVYGIGGLILITLPIAFC